MRSRTVGVIAALVAVPTAAAVIPGRLDAATTATRSSWSSQSSSAKGGTATLVSVNVTTTNDDATASPAQTQAGRRLVGAQCTNPGAGTNAYNLSGSRVTAPTTAHLNPARGPSGSASVFQAAYNTWKAADANAPSISVATDSSASAPSANHRYELMFKPLGGRTLAITYTWHWSTGEYESDTAFNTNVAWFIAPGEGDGCYESVNAYDLGNTATHEFGHQYGLSHVSSQWNTMAPKVAKGATYMRSLASGDAAGIRAIY